MYTPEALIAIKTRRFRLFARFPHLIIDEETWCIEGNTELRITRYPFCFTFVFTVHGFGIAFDIHDGSMWNQDKEEQ